VKLFTTEDEKQKKILQAQQSSPYDPDQMSGFVGTARTGYCLFLTCTYLWFWSCSFRLLVLLSHQLAHILVGEFNLWSS